MIPCLIIVFELIQNVWDFSTQIQEILFVVGLVCIIYLSIKFKKSNFNKDWIVILSLLFIISFFIPKWGYLQRAEIFGNKYMEYAQDILEINYSEGSLRNEYTIFEKYTDIQQIELIDSQTVSFRGSNDWFGLDEYIIISYNDIVEDWDLQVGDNLQENTQLLSGCVQKIKEIRNHFYYLEIRY